MSVEQVREISVGNLTLGINYTGVVIPYKPPIDKIAAMLLVQIHNQLDIEEVLYWKDNRTPPGKLAEWQRKGICPIDIGVRKYHKAGVQSATEYVVKEHNLQLTPGMQEVLALVNDNNKTGSLKESKYSVAKLCREFYELTDDEAYHHEVINHTANVIHSFIRVEDGERTRTEPVSEVVFRPYLVTFAECKNAPMTLGRYLSDLWALGEPEADIMEKLGFWLDGATRTHEAQVSGKAEFDAMNSRDEFQIGAFKGIVLRTDNRYVVGAAVASGRYQIRIIKNASGHTTLSTYRHDLSELAAVLQEKEPDQWYYQPEMGALINGGPQYVGVAPTKIYPGQLIALLKQHPPVLKPGKRRS